MSHTLQYGKQWIEDDDIAAVVSVLKSDWLTQGPKIAEFEEKVAAYCGARYAVAFSSGTAALHAACFAAGVGPGDEAITSPLSFAASSNCAVYLGATPRFVDIEANGFNMDPVALAKILTPKTRVVVAVDFSGHPCDLDEIVAAARKNGSVVIEDAAHSLGARYRSKLVGSQADMTALSFHPVKHVTTGEGGMVLTASADYRDRLLKFRSHGIVKPASAAEQPWYYEMVDLGFNYRITDIQCALGLSQLAKLERFLARRRAIASSYHEAFAEHPLVKTLPATPYVNPAYHLFVVRIEFEKLDKSRSQVVAQMRERGVGTQVHYIPIHLHPYYRQRYGFKPGDFPQAEGFYGQALSLPMYPKMDDRDVAHVIETVEAVVPR